MFLKVWIDFETFPGITGIRQSCPKPSRGPKRVNKTPKTQNPEKPSEGGLSLGGEGVIRRKSKNMKKTRFLRFAQKLCFFKFLKVWIHFETFPSITGIRQSCPKPSRGPKKTSPKPKTLKNPRRGDSP